MTSESVAVVTDELGELTRFAGNMRVAVYRKTAGVWACQETIPFCVDEGENLARMRDKLRDFVARLGDTRILAATAITGVAYAVLDQRGFRLCEMDSFSHGCLDALVEEANAPARTPAVFDHPEATSIPGHYVCDLTAILREYPELSSKKILRPFFDGTPFIELQIFFGHMPPWLLPELAQRGLGCDKSVASDGRLCLRVFPLPCSMKDTPAN
ncbi:MAG: hypothetical protein LBO64_00185 [Desulfovibrio sp.]|jgi:hypothetical protein|nr:hypothetical protein [Desulfovibrio sp.]